MYEAGETPSRILTIDSFKSGVSEKFYVSKVRYFFQSLTQSSSSKMDVSNGQIRATLKLYLLNGENVTYARQQISMVFGKTLYKSTSGCNGFGSDISITLIN